MDAARQVVRWSLPGLVLLLWMWVGFRLIPAPAVVPNLFAEHTVLAMLSSLPCGFLIYQIYCQNYRPFSSRVWLWVVGTDVVRHDRAGAMLRHAISTDITTSGRLLRIAAGLPRDAPLTLQRRLLGLTLVDALDLAAYGPAHDGPHDCVVVSVWRRHRRHYGLDLLARLRLRSCSRCRDYWSAAHHHNQALMTALLDLLADEGSVALKTEYATGSDIYHAIGAARTAITLSTVAVLTSATVTAMPQLVLPAAVFFVLSVVMWLALHHSRTAAMESYRRRIGHGIALALRKLDSKTVAAHKPTYIVRPGFASDLPECRALAQQAFGGDATAWMSQFLDSLPGAYGLVVAEHAGCVVGFGLARMMLDDPSALPRGWYLSDLVVHPDHRRRGIGTAITKARIAWITPRASEVYYVTESANFASVALHERAGFGPVSEHGNPNKVIGRLALPLDVRAAD